MIQTGPRSKSRSGGTSAWPRDLNLALRFDFSLSFLASFNSRKVESHQQEADQGKLGVRASQRWPMVNTDLLASKTKFCEATTPD